MGPKGDATGIRLVLVDDLVLLRESLSRYLSAEPDFEVAAECGSAAEGLDALTQSPVDVVVIDRRLLMVGKSHFIAAAYASGFRGKVLVLIEFSDLERSLAELQLGATGVFLKDSSPDLLAKAIRLVAGGNAWLDPRVINLLTDRAVHGQPKPFRVPLSKREEQVLAGLCEGLTNRRIAEKLEVSEGTVKATLRGLFRRAQVQTRSQLVRIALCGPAMQEKR
jgi:DNA-binding NarL/FixJ family response regulator